MSESSTVNCPDCARPLDATAACLPCAITQALEAAAQVGDQAADEGPEGGMAGFASLADPVLPMRLGRFKLLRRIESGGMGVVYEAEDSTLERRVALKMIRAFRFASTEEQQRFDLEARAAARLDHPNIVPVFDVGESEGHAFLSMKLIAGESLSARLKRGRLETCQAIGLMAHLARAVQHAHDKGVLHRDLKPSNVIIDAQEHPWLIDFGMARLSDALSGITLTGGQIGTPSYMSPEQAAGRNSEIGPASDVWALGAMLYQMLTGKLPFSGENHLAIIQAVLTTPSPVFVPGTRAEASLAAILARCLEKDPARRLGSAGELAAELERWLAGESIQSQPRGSASKCLHWLMARPLMSLALVLLLGIASLGPRVLKAPAKPSPHYQQGAHVTPPGEKVDANFGRSVAIQGDTMVVGAPLHEHGMAHVYQSKDGKWVLQMTLMGSHGDKEDHFGRAVALSGDTLVIGAHNEDSGTSSPEDDSTPDSGAVYVFTRRGSTWEQTAYLKSSSPQLGAGFGRAVAAHGGTIVVGARLEREGGLVGSGAAYVFVHDGSEWRQQARLTSPKPGKDHLFGISVAVENDTLIVGADGEDSLKVPRHYYTQRQPNVGAAYVFTRVAGAWSLQARLAPPTGGGGCFGYAVALSGDTALVGAYRENSSTSSINSTPDLGAREAGAAYVFVRAGAKWSQQSYLKPHNNGPGYRFGYHLALEGDVALVGAYVENTGTSGVNSTPNTHCAEAGAAYVFERSGADWAQTAYLKPGITIALDHFGIATAMSGKTLVVGSCGNDRVPFGSGQVWTFERR